MMIKLIGACRRRVDRPLLLHIFAGGLLGVVISFLVAAVMLEISDNRFFAIYFGLMFLIIGLAVAKRVTLSIAWREGGRLARTALGLFASIVLFASLSCFILDHNALKLTPHQRIPFYILLGMAVSFAVTFAIVDIVNMATKTLHSIKQVFVILGASVLTGSIFGLIFGILDVEDDPSVRHGLIRDERYTAPVGLAVGIAATLITRRIGEREVEISEVPSFVDQDL